MVVEGMLRLITAIAVASPAPPGHTSAAPAWRPGAVHSRFLKPCPNPRSTPKNFLPCSWFPSFPTARRARPRRASPNRPFRRRRTPRSGSTTPTRATSCTDRRPTAPLPSRCRRSGRRGEARGRHAWRWQKSACVRPGRLARSAVQQNRARPWLDDAGSGKGRRGFRRYRKAGARACRRMSGPFFVRDAPIGGVPSCLDCPMAHRLRKRSPPPRAHAMQHAACVHHPDG